MEYVNETQERKNQRRVVGNAPEAAPGFVRSGLLVLPPWDGTAYNLPDPFRTGTMGPVYTEESPVEIVGACSFTWWRRASTYPRPFESTTLRSH